MKAYFEIACPACGCEHYIQTEITRPPLWQGGDLFQLAMPEASAEDREQLVTGLCPMCQEDAFRGRV